MTNNINIKNNNISEDLFRTAVMVVSLILIGLSVFFLA